MPSLARPPSACGPSPAGTELSSAPSVTVSCTGPSCKEGEGWQASPSRKIPAPPVFTIRAGGVNERWTCSFFFFFYSLFIEEVEGLGLLRWELGEGAAPLHQAPRSVVLHVGLRFGLLYGRRAGGGAKQSAEAAGGEVTESHRGRGVGWEETGGGGEKKECGDRARHGGHQRTTQSRRPEIRRVRVREKHAGRAVNHRL